MNFIFCGFMGCGKTTVGHALADRLHRKFVDTDQLVEAKQGMTISQIFDTRGEAFFRKLEQEACRTVSMEKNRVVSTGGGALTIPENVALLRQTGKIILLDVPFAVLAQRVGAGIDRPLFRDPAKANALYEARMPLYRAAADIVIDGDGTPEQVVQRILDTL